MARTELLKYFTILTGDTKDADADFVRMLREHIPRMQEVFEVEECDVILAFCPVVSRAGTNIEAALIRLDNESANKPVVLVVLFHTINPEEIVPDSSKSVNRANTFTVDCVFHEDQQLWKCNTNYDAIAKVTKHLKSEVEYGKKGWGFERLIQVITRAPVINRRAEHDEYDDDPDSAKQPLLQNNARGNAEEEYLDTSSRCRFCCSWIC